MKRILAVSAALALLATQVWAANITVDNFSFELPGTGKIVGWNGESGTDIPGWASDYSAVDSGVESDWPGHTEGLWTAFLYNLDCTNGPIWNLTAHTIAAGEEFLLKVDAQNNWTSAGTPILRLGLYYDVAGVRNTLATTDVNPGSPWATFSLVAYADSVPASIGNPLGIELWSALPGPDRSYLGLDNVVLLVPEPGTIALLGLGALALVLVRRRA
jgi:hypothetical protein